MPEALCRRIDAINEWVGKTVAWLFIPLTLFIVVDVFTRYVLTKPWYYIDINVQIMGTLIVLGAGYCHLHQGHVAVDILVSRLSTRKRAILDLILFSLFLVGMGGLLWKLAGAAWNSLLVLERSSTVLEPPIYPYRAIMVVGVFLLVLQGTAKFIRDLKIITSPKPGGKP